MIQTKEMYVVQGSGFGGQESSTYAHEYTACTYKTRIMIFEKDWNSILKIANLIRRDAWALQALIEGDATVTEQKWLTSYARQ